MAIAKPTRPKLARKARLLVIDDHPLVREQVVQLIQREPDLEVCAQADSAEQALQAVRDAAPELAVVDFTVRDSEGFKLVAELLDTDPKLLVLVLSMREESMYGERALRAGAKGYLAKHEASGKLVDAIHRILRGEIYVSDKLNRLLLRKMADASLSTGDNPIEALTERETEVFQLLGQGLVVREIATRLLVSSKTVEAHREHIKRKLKFKTSSELLRFAIEYRMQVTH